MERNFIDGYTEWQSNPEIVGVNKASATRNVYAL